MKQFLILLFAALCGTVGYTQDYRIEAITVADGLSQGFILSSFEDSRGFVWIGTFNGLNRYDGYQIKRFTPNHRSPWSLRANFIYCIAEDAQGLLWLGTDKGLVVMDIYTERFIHLLEIDPTFPASEVLHIRMQEDGQIWLSYQQMPESGVYIVRPPADLLHLIRQDALQGHAFQVRSVHLPDDVEAPLRWLETGYVGEVAAVDQRGQFYRLHAATLQVQIADPRSLVY
ncbi:MAG: hypothetical protein LH618_13375, partial [Saprospiraceae bacterium]|nr:hypothetical protein [Saprospiraceae bacterium]